MQGWKDELLQRHQIEGVQTPVIKGEDTKESGVGGAVKQKSIEAPNIEIEVEDCEEYIASFSFYVVSGSDLSQVHMVVENLGATEASQLKDDTTAYERQRHLREKV